MKKTPFHISDKAIEQFVNKVDKSFEFPRDSDPYGPNGLWDDEIAAFADARTLKALYFSEDWVYITIDAVAQKLSSVDLNVVKKTPNREGNLVTEIQHDHGLVPLIQMPNPWQEYPSWMYNYVVEDALSGNGINWFAKNTGHLLIIPTDQVTLRTDSNGRLETYWVSIQSMTGAVAPATGDGQGIAIPAKDVIHTRRPNPASLIWGMSPLTPGRKSILFNRYSQDYLNAFYLKQATPGMAIEMDRTVNEELAVRQLGSFESAYTGRRNARRTLLLPKGTSVKTLTHSLSDQKLVEVTGMNRESLLALYSVPKHEVGLQEAGSLGSEEHRLALRNFWLSELIPTGHRIAGSLTQFFRRQKMLEPDEFFEFDFESVEALQDDLMQKALTAKEMAQTMPLNLVLQKVWQEDPINDPRGELPLSLAPTGGVAVNATGDEIGQVRKPGSDENREPDADESEPDEADGQKNFAAKYLAKHGDWLDRTIKALEDQVNDAGDKIETLSLNLFVDFAEKTVNVLRRSLRDSKSIQTKVDKPSDAVLRRRLEREFDEFEEQYVDEYSDILRPTVEVGYDSQLEFVFNAEKLEDIAILRARDDNNRKAILTARGLETFAGVSKRTSDEVVTEIKRGIEANENITDITARVARKIGENGISRSIRIARTETLTAASIGQNAAFEHADEVSPGYKKVWLNSEDSRVRGNPNGKYPNSGDDHWKLQGQTRLKGQAFDNGLQYPRDIRSDDPAKVINCRCTLAMLPPDSDLEDFET